MNKSLTVKQMKKVKTYVITLSKNFMKGHPKAGQPTSFKEKFLSGEKIHTIRDNYQLWEKRIKEVQEGKAILSIRQWSDKPYRSPQIAIKDLIASDGVGLQKFRSVDEQFGYYVNENGNVLGSPLIDFAKNDGLNYDDFDAWFNEKPTPNNPYAIIHFTPFRYK